MNKVILLSDMEVLPKGALDFAAMLNEQEPILLVGVFLPKVDYWNTLLFYSFGAASPWLYYTPETEDVLVSDIAATAFRKRCEQLGIEYRTHEISNKDVRTELKIESRFADLILMSNASFYEGFSSETYNEYADTVLHKAECPVIVVPEQFKKPENLIVAYDGSHSSVFAIKQFAAVLPELTKLDTLLVYVDPEGAEAFPDMSLIEELAARHFSQLTLFGLDIDPETYFSTWLSERGNTLLVTGAGSRSGLSEMLKRSFISKVLQENNVPVFIAHD